MVTKKRTLGKRLSFSFLILSLLCMIFLAPFALVFQNQAFYEEEQIKHAVYDQLGEENVRTKTQSIVDYLEGAHEAKHYTIQDLKAMRKKYRKMIKELEAQEV